MIDYVIDFTNSIIVVNKSEINLQMGFPALLDQLHPEFAYHASERNRGINVGHGSWEALQSNLVIRYAFTWSVVNCVQRRKR